MFMFCLLFALRCRHISTRSTNTALHSDSDMSGSVILYKLRVSVFLLAEPGTPPEMAGSCTKTSLGFYWSEWEAVFVGRRRHVTAPLLQQQFSAPLQLVSFSVQSQVDLCQVMFKIPTGFQMRGVATQQPEHFKIINEWLLTDLVL